MVKVKICGITNVLDAKNAVVSGADAIGVVFAPSPRQVTEAQAKKIVDAVGPWMPVVGVFVNQDLEWILSVAKTCRLAAIQLHGDESLSYTKKISSYKVIRAFRIQTRKDLEKAKSSTADAHLFDAKVPGFYGGTGKAFDWNLLKAYRSHQPWIVSGGLNPYNVEDLVRRLNPYGVDVSSGVEKSAGKKDHELVREFIRNAKAF